MKDSLMRKIAYLLLLVFLASSFTYPMKAACIIRCFNECWKSCWKTPSLEERLRIANTDKILDGKSVARLFLKDKNAVCGVCNNVLYDNKSPVLRLNCQDRSMSLEDHNIHADCIEGQTICPICVAPLRLSDTQALSDLLMKKFETSVRLAGAHEAFGVDEE